MRLVVDKLADIECSDGASGHLLSRTDMLVTSMSMGTYSLKSPRWEKVLVSYLETIVQRGA